MKLSVHGTPPHSAAPPSPKRLRAHAPNASAVWVGGFFLSLAAVGCGGGGASHPGSGNAVGSTVDHPDTSLGSLHFVVDASDGGFSTSPRVKGVKWGRLANIYDSTGTLQQKDMVIGEDIPNADPANFQLDINPVTDETAVTIGHAYGSLAYSLAFKKLDQNLIPILDKSLDPNELPPFSLAPRNSAIVVLFDDLLDHATIKAATVKILTGNPPIVPFDARIIPDVNYGDLADFDGNGQPEFHSTRVIVDTTVSELESAASNPPIPVNALGLPASSTNSLPNVALRIPTLQDPASGQLSILRNASGHALSFTQSGSTDPSSPTHDIVRAMRSGGATDAHNGFLLDQVLPKVVGTLPVTLGTVIQPTVGVNEYLTSVTFAYSVCASKMKAGDVLQQPGVFGEVTQASANPVGATIALVHFKVVFPPFDPGAPVNTSLTAGQAEHSSVFDATANFNQQACFVRFPAIAQPPSQKVATDSPVIVRFSEPIDPASVKPFDSFTITRISGTPTASDYIVGSVTPTSDLREFRFIPVLPFKHTVLAAEHYFVNVFSGAAGPRDLAGNELAVPLPQVDFQIDPNEATENTAGFALRFSSDDELPPAGRELRGQFLYDLNAGEIDPRPVNRFPAAATRDKPVPAIMPMFGPGVQTPLSSLGSKMQTLWRYCDVGFALGDESFYNVDVENLDWAPVGGNVIADQFDSFSIGLSHCLKLPDETKWTTPPLAPLPKHFLSGLVTTFNSNVLDPVNDPITGPNNIVHPKQLGYNVNPADRFITTTTPPVTMMPFPLNRTIPINQYRYYTWRDTSLQAKGCPPEANMVAGGVGAELEIVILVLNLGGTGGITPGTPYSPGNVPTIGLPLLMEFRCYPDSGALGLNSFDVNLAVNSSSQPNFRAFSTGGTSSSGVPILKDPDLETVATGGFNPTSNPPGAPTLPTDNTVYLGQMDLVIRVSRAHSIWFNTNSATVVYSAPVIEPHASDEPLGTQVQLHYRGATLVTGNVLTDAPTNLDFYGEAIAGGGSVTFLNNDKTWKASLSQLQGAKYFQVRITFVSNTATLLSPTLSALGFAFRL